MSKNKKFKIIAIICSYNDRKGLEKIIPALLSQTYKLEEIVVIDNASSDGGPQMIREKFSQVTLFVNQSNLGVSGGYNRGMDYAYKKKYDWIWLLDGDSLPKKTALEELIKAFISFKDVYKIGILASSPVNILSNTKLSPFIWKGRFKKVSEEMTNSKKPFLVDAVISSGSLINRDIIKKIGLLRVDFFMDSVDQEYCLRVRKKGYQIVYVPMSILNHELGENIIEFKRGNTITKIISSFLGKKTTTISSEWRLYYITRNQLFMYLYEFPSLKAVCFLMGWIIKTIIFNLIGPYTHKRQRIKYLFLGMRDGFKSKLGRTIEPCV